MAEPTRDNWAEWLLDRGAAGDKAGWVEFLRPIRDRVLDGARLSDGVQGENQSIMSYIIVFRMISYKATPGGAVPAAFRGGPAWLRRRVRRPPLSRAKPPGPGRSTRRSRGSRH